MNNYLRLTADFPRRFAWLLVAGLALPIEVAEAGTATGKNTGNFTSGGVSGSGWEDGGTVTITYANGVVKQATVNANGNFYSPQPANVPNNTGFTASGPMAGGTAGTAPGTLAQRFSPPDNRVRTEFTVAAGSTATIGGNTIPLMGQFTTIETTYDYNQFSATYGDMTGSVLASSFSLGNPGLGLDIDLPSDLPFTINLAGVATAAGMDNFQSATAGVGPIPLNLIVNLNNQPHSATGSVSGTGTFYLGDDNDYVFDANMSSDLGSISIHLLTDAPSFLVPEPNTFIIWGIASAFLGLARRRP